MKHVILVLAVGCSATQPSIGGGDDDGSGSGSGSAMTPEVLTGSIFDERNDTIDYATGEPSHTHGGAPIDLMDGCPDVYKYAYLEGPRLYGSETAPNPLQWRITTVSEHVSYEVTDDAGVSIVASTQIRRDSDGSYTIAPIAAALRTTTGTMRLVVHVDDARQTACWVNHPMAPPLHLLDPARDLRLTMADRGEISNVMNLANPAGGAFGQTVMDIQFDQTTAEPIHVMLWHAPITGAAKKDIADGYVKIDEYPDSIGCGTSPCPSFGAALHYQPAAQAIAGTFMLEIFDFSTNTVICSSQTNAVDCTIPARGANERPHVYDAILTISAERSISPGVDTLTSTTYSDQRIGTTWVSGLVDAAVYKGCVQGLHNAGGTYTCVKSADYKHVMAVNQAQIAFDTIRFQLATLIGDESTVVATPELTAFTWDTGVAGI